MNATLLLSLSFVTTAFAPLDPVQESRGKVGPRVPVDVSVEGLGEASRRAPEEMAGAIGLSAGRPSGSTTPLDCLERIADQSSGGCLIASSTPTLGRLYPYPGLGNRFSPQAFVGGGENNRASGPWSMVGAGQNNLASGGSSTVGGGHNNQASGRWSTVAGGYNNSAYGSGYYGYFTTVGGGDSNLASSFGATVAGGSRNTASGYFSAVAGGSDNTASSFGATVGGGLFNSAEGARSTVAGGERNSARGAYSFAAGRRAKANHDGAFVWGDGRNVTKSSSRVNEFNVFCSGGARFFTNPTATSGVLLAPGGSTWTMVSDRDAKENVVPVDAHDVLDKVARLPLATWNYKDQPDSIRHMGPMAQDFHAAFGLGLGEKTIDTIDPNGVALAAIQGLNELVEERGAEIQELRAANEELRARVERLEALARGGMAR